MKPAVRYLLLAALCIGAFWVTYKAVLWSAGPQPVDYSATHAAGMPTTGGAPQPPGQAPPGMVWIPGGEFTMGSDFARAWDDEQPPHRVRVDGFWMDATEVTNAEFQKFVDATGYVTTAERAPDLNEIMKQVPPDTPPPDPKLLVPGAVVFTPPSLPVPLDNVAGWWSWTPGANWRHPTGPDSSLEGLADHPVVHVSWDDAVAYAKWAGKHLPTEAEWEFAARGGLANKTFIWGDEPPDDKHVFANIWQGHFPDKNLQTDGFVRTAPVKSFRPNGYGLYDMGGNVWEWCNDWYQRDLYATRAGNEVVENPTGPEKSFDPVNPYTPERAQRGGSFLCHESYCERYRPSARHGTSPDTGMSHVGFRCVQRPNESAAAPPKGKGG